MSRAEAASGALAAVASLGSRSFGNRRSSHQDAEALELDEQVAMGQVLDLSIRVLLAGQMPVFANFVSHLHRCHGSSISAGMTREEHPETRRHFEHEYLDETPSRPGRRR